MDEKENKSIPLKDRISYLYFFYYYSFQEKGDRLLIIGLVNFLLGLLPLALVYFFEIQNLCPAKQKMFFGDGSLIIFCFGVLVSFVTLKFDGIKKTFNNRNDSFPTIILLITSIVYYLVAYKVFEKAQTNFSRSWSFIQIVNGISILFIIVAFFIVVYIQLTQEIDFSEVNRFREEIKARKNVKKAIKKKSSENVEL